MNLKHQATDFPGERYYKPSGYFRHLTGGTKVSKVGIDAGFSCPNRDGKISPDGCIYCDNRGFSLNARKPQIPLDAQIREGLRSLKEKTGAEKFIIYFQAYTNTYAPVNVLKEKYDAIKKFEDVIGISIATRPDCVNEEILDLIDSYGKDYEVWIEYGLQSIHDKTLEFINRRHTYKDFLKAIELTRKRKNIKICAHVIIGLPSETKAMIYETAKALGGLKVDGVKIHPLHVMKDTKLEALFNQGLYVPPGLDEYVDLAVGFLEYLCPDTVIQRISADCPRDLLAAPEWILDKNRVLAKIEEKLVKENRFQGRLFSPACGGISLAKRLLCSRRKPDACS